MKEWQEQDIDFKLTNKHEFWLYLYTPMCGTCQVASKMIKVVDEILPHVTIGKSDLNYLPQKAMEWQIESVPCLLHMKDEKVIEKYYAFHSVPYLLEIVSKD
ncbi:thioredoxin family protein [Fredinandcohnia sp. QZ13]|uniref:thioredoxin family protein n=1 Tax=Fredinandcohnia sp. QZ13 TaxID=3073144 RepID=UPI002852FAF9|nr:thioredoxin family protein [Fredinandcohnia sp. QZ13]MDR4889458.1 thioredoxin family protein [Fredinandcohnia sp. QZ13]